MRALMKTGLAATLAFGALILAGCGAPREEGKPNVAAPKETATTATAAAPTVATNSATTPEGTVTLEFWHYFTREHEKALREIIARFEQANPAIKIKPVFQGTPPQLSQKLSTALAATPSNNPALSTIYENWTSDYVAKGYMDAVQDHFAGPDPLPPAEQEDFVKVFREANRFGGKWVTMPFNKSIYMLYFNADMLAKAGVTTAPRTLDEFREMVLKTTVRDAGRTTCFGFGAMPTGEAFTTLYFACGGEYLDASNKPVFYNDTAVKVLTFLKNLQFPEKNIFVDGTYMSTPLGQKQVASFIYSSASFPFVEKSVGGQFKWDVAPIPGDGKASPAYLMQGTNVGIFANKSDAEKAAAWKFLKFLTSVDSCTYWATHTGYMPIRYSMLNHPDLKSYMQANPQYGVASALVLGDLGRQEPKLAVWEDIRTNINDMVNSVLSQGADPKEQLEKAVKSAQDKLDRAAKR